MNGEQGSILIVLMIAAIAGYGWESRRSNRHRSVLWTLAGSALIGSLALLALNFIITLILTSLQGHPAGHHPFVVAFAATVLLAPGLVLYGVVPAAIGGLLGRIFPCPCS